MRRVFNTQILCNCDKAIHLIRLKICESNKTLKLSVIINVRDNNFDCGKFKHIFYIEKFIPQHMKNVVKRFKRRQNNRGNAILKSQHRTSIGKLYNIMRKHDVHLNIINLPTRIQYTKRVEIITGEIASIFAVNDKARFLTQHCPIHVQNTNTACK